ncbi:hypothetical protein [Solicola sp. PLA-1-18]|uniref:hypothetical protein n=1 Tax=Solicola sp. PLA-1-18 TaxID=3380532 RepID=UPI003B7D109F
MSPRRQAQTMRALQNLDSAATGPLDHIEQRASRTLEQILKAAPGEPTSNPGPGRPTLLRNGRTVLIGAVLAATVVAAIVIPLLTRVETAFASWSPSPASLQGTERTTTVEACLKLQSGDGGSLALDPTAKPTVLVAERRGGWSYILFRVPGASQPELEGSCLVPNSVVADPQPGQGNFFGRLDGVDDLTDPSPNSRLVRQDTSQLGTIGDDAFASVEGTAGSDVARIQVRTPSGRKVEASIESGHWAAWWPVGGKPTTNPDWSEPPSYRITLRDGTIVDARTLD